MPNAFREADGLMVSSKVRVRTFVYNPSTKAYEFKQDGADRPALIWTAAVSPESSSTVLPADDSRDPEYSGAAISPVSEELGRFPTYDIEDFEDYILVFPADSGLPPVYVMFNSPRYLPGVVSGFGGDIDPQWETKASGGLGSPIPAVVADALRGNEYAQFRNFKRAIWREMSKHAEITQGMSERNIKLIKQGKAPIAPNAEQKNGRRWYEIHHISLISKGGDVYGIDNLGINTPAQHDRIHQDIRKNEERP
ncbi:S-type pyocin domain-containing protein [Pseudomonas lutea]|uniref:S-type pyocin domain-containing protein n=1 Tax=Pseudomonas lutea TaxID=243924 RepID=UPI0012698B9F|nr:S-type pyocin domain-containing protein [Pseudomonas lutea]